MFLIACVFVHRSRGGPEPTLQLAHAVCGPLARPAACADPGPVRHVRQLPVPRLPRDGLSVRRGGHAQRRVHDERRVAAQLLLQAVRDVIPGGRLPAWAVSIPPVHRA